MLQQPEPDDFVIGTGETHSVREFLELAFSHAGLDWREHVKIDPRYFRPAEVDLLLADATKARQRLGWAPRVTLPGAGRAHGRLGSRARGSREAGARLTRE